MASQVPERGRCVNPLLGAVHIMVAPASAACLSLLLGALDGPQLLQVLLALLPLPTLSLLLLCPAQTPGL